MAITQEYFDEVMNISIKKARKAERERIIKLIQPFVDCEACNNGNVTSDCSAEMAQHLIDLINGENN